MKKDHIFWYIPRYIIVFIHFLGPTLIAVQASMDFPTLTNVMPVMSGKNDIISSAN